MQPRSRSLRVAVVRCRRLSIPLLRYGIPAAAGAFIAACGGGTTEPPAGIVTQVVVTPVADTLVALNATRQFTAVAKDASGNTLSGKTFTWSSTAEAVATVSATGLVTALGNGTANIKAQVEGVAGSAAVVVAQEVLTVTVTPASDTLAAVGDTTRFAAQAKDANGSAVSGVRFVWLSSDPAIASIDTTGLATSRGRGRVTIIAIGRGVPGYGALLVNYVRYQAVTVGTYHACGLSEGGKAYCWGSAGHGQVGAGFAGTGYGANSPRTVLGGLTFKALSAGGKVPFDTAHTCGVTLAGAAYCWGSNESGQLGDGTATDRSQPVAVLGGIVFASITLGAQHTCGLTAGGAAYCWGANNRGQLGDGGTTPRSQPWPVSGGIVFSQISAGGNHTCGLTVSNVAYCWGQNSSGELGDNSTTERHAPTPVSGSLAIALIGAGGSHTCARPTNNPGTLYCWGANGKGQLGIATTALDSVPRFVYSIAGFSVSAGEAYHTCALEARSDVYCWGYNFDGELGNGTFVDASRPTAVLGGLKFAQVDAGGFASCGVVKATGEIYCWGSDYYGLLGAGNVSSGIQNPSSSAVPIRVAEPSP